MKLSLYERETIINFNESEATASVYTMNRALQNRLKRLAEDRSGDCVLEHTSKADNAVEYIIPKRWIKISPPRIMSEAQRAALEKAQRALNKAL